MKPVPRILPFILGATVLMSMAYLMGRYFYLRDDMQLPPVPSTYKLAFVFDPWAIAEITVLPVLSAIPTLIVRKRLIGSWFVFAASLLASSLIYSMVAEWSAKIIWAGSDAGYLDAYIIISVLLYAVLAFVATIWVALTRPPLNSEPSRPT